MQTCYTAGLVEGAQTTLRELGTSMGSFTTHIMSKIKEIMAHMTTKKRTSLSSGSGSYVVSLQNSDSTDGAGRVQT